MARILVLALVAVILPGCAVYRLTSEEQEALERLETLGLRRTEAGQTPPASIGLANAWGPLGILFGPQLGVVPLGGAGNFYLSSRDEERGTSQLWLGVLNSVLWPVSPLWSVPQVIRDAQTVNEKETTFYFDRTARGAAVMAAWRSRIPGPPTEISPPGPETAPAKPPEEPAPGEAPPVAPPAEKK